MEAMASIRFSHLHTSPPLSSPSIIPKLAHYLILSSPSSIHLRISTYTPQSSLKSHLYPSNFPSIRSTFELHSSAEEVAVLETPSDKTQIIKNKDGKHRGFDFITMSSGEEAQAVVDKLNSKVFNVISNEVEDSSQKQKTRGVTTRLNLKSKDLKKLHIDFDDYGQPTGFYASKFATHMGVLARNIKITYRSWKKVPWGEKETLWKIAKNTWKLSDDKQQIVLKILSGSLKEFRSRLTRTYITKTLKPKEGAIIGDSPVGKYKAITNEIWEEFKQQRMDKRFIEISKKARASQRMNLHPHYLGREGYVGKKEKWYKDELAHALTQNKLENQKLDNDDSDPTLLQESVALLDERFSDRGYLWIKAHTPSSTAPPPQIQEVTENYWVWKEKQQTGEFVPTKFEDALVKALGKPEHNGRTRGVGGNVGLRTFFGKQTTPSSKGKIYTEDDMI